MAITNSKKARRWRVHSDTDHALECAVSDRIAVCGIIYSRAVGGYSWGIYGFPNPNGYPLAFGVNEDAAQAKRDARAALDRIAAEIDAGTFIPPGKGKSPL